MTNPQKMHPPADRRCQIYTTGSWRPADHTYERMTRCVNEGTHWVKWGGCNCGDPDTQYCEGDYFSWECDGDGHVYTEAAA